MLPARLVAAGPPDRLVELLVGLGRPGPGSSGVRARPGRPWSVRSVSPSCSSPSRASRIGVRLTPHHSARVSSVRGWPAGNSPLRMAALISSTRAPVSRAAGAAQTPAFPPPTTTSAVSLFSMLRCTDDSCHGFQRQDQVQATHLTDNYLDNFLNLTLRCSRGHRPDVRILR